MIGMYYKRYEMQKRYTVYNTSGIVAGAFGGVNSLHSFPTNYWLTKQLASS